MGRHLLLVLVILNYSCSNTRAKREIDSEKENDDVHFRITNLKINNIAFSAEKYSSDYNFRYDGQGFIKNLTQYVLSEYVIRLNFKLTNEKGESFFVKDEIALSINLDDGFGGGSFFPIERKMPWKPNENLEFKIHDYLSHNAIIYPITKAEVIYELQASDPFHHEFVEIVGVYDISEAWLRNQHHYEDHLRKNSKRSMADKDRISDTALADEPLPKSEVGNLDPKALYGSPSRAGFNLAIGGWEWAHQPATPDIPDDGDGRIVFEIECNEQGEIVGITTLELGLSTKAEELIKDEIRRTSLVRSYSGKIPPKSKGQVVFVLKRK